MALVRCGTATVPEVAELAGVSRQVVRYWCKVAKVDIGKARSLMLSKAWRRRLALGRK